MACLVKPTRLSFTRVSDLLMLTVLYVLSYKITSHKIRNKQLEDFSSVYKDVGKYMQTQRSEISTTYSKLTNSKELEDCLKSTV